MDFEFVSQVVSQLAGAAPLLLAYVIGLYLAAVNWQRAPQPSLLTFLACGLMLLTMLGRMLASAWIIQHAQEWGHARVGGSLTAIGVASSVAFAGGMGLLLAAVFSGRDAPSADD